MDAIRFFVPGLPRPGGSKKGIPVKSKSGKWRALVVEDSKHTAPWRAVVALAAQDHFPAGPLTGPVAFRFEFRMPRPGSHYGTGRNADTLKPNAPEGHTIKPDTTKLIRSTEDALKGIAWVDDCQVVDQSATKLYANDRRPGCWITIRPFEKADPVAEGAKAGASSGAGVGARATTPGRTVTDAPGLFDDDETALVL